MSTIAPDVVTLIMFALLAAVFTIGYRLAGGTAHTAGQIFGTPVLWLLTLALVLCARLQFSCHERLAAVRQRDRSGPDLLPRAGHRHGLVWISTGLDFASGLDFLRQRIADLSLLVGGVLIVSATVLVATEKRTA